jgi:hypothetical protein
LYATPKLRRACYPPRELNVNDLRGTGRANRSVRDQARRGEKNFCVGRPARLTLAAVSASLEADTDGRLRSRAFATGVPV